MRFPQCAWILLPLAAACADSPTADLSAPPSAPALEDVALRCTATVATAELSCTHADGGTGVNRTLVTYGGQHRNVRLANSGNSVAGSVFSFNVTVQNLLQQPLATENGTTPDPAGVQVFFSSLQGTGGTGPVTVLNPTGTGTFTAADQPYFQYGGSAGGELGADGVLSTGETSLSKQWQIDFGQHARFSFVVYVRTRVPDASATSLRFVHIAAGGSHTCGLTSAGRAYCWGYGYSGNLGQGRQQDESVPVPVVMPDDEVFTQLAGGHSQTCAVAASGQAYCWGTASQGTLGAGGLWQTTVPVAVHQPAGVRFTRIGTGFYHTCAIGPSGTYCWGTGELLGDGGGEDSGTPMPVALPAGERLVDVSTGRAHTCGIAESGTTYCWGLGSNGQLGDGSFTAQDVPVAVSQPQGVTFTRVYAGYDHTCALTEGGAAYCWGYGIHGQLGDGFRLSASVPVAVHQPLGTFFETLSTQANAVATCGLAGTGLYCWGRETVTLSGDWEYWVEPVAIAAPAGTEFRGIAIGADHKCARTTTGTVCWGSGWSGQLGNGTLGTSVAAVPVAGTRGP